MNKKNNARGYWRGNNASCLVEFQRMKVNRNAQKS